MRKGFKLKIWRAIKKRVKIKNSSKILKLAYGDQNNQVLHKKRKKFCKWSREIFGTSKGECHSPLGFHPQTLLQFILTGKGISLEEQARLKQTLGIT